MTEEGRRLEEARQALPGVVRLGSHANGQVEDSGDHLLRRFADLVFVRPQDKLKLYWLFQRSTWQPARRVA